MKRDDVFDTGEQLVYEVTDEDLERYLKETVSPPRVLGDPPHELDRFKKSLLEVEAVLRRGRVKYPESLWLRQTTLIHVQHALNHLDDLMTGRETGEDHLAHAACRLLMALEKRNVKKDR